MLAAPLLLGLCCQPRVVLGVLELQLVVLRPSRALLEVRVVLQISGVPTRHPVVLAEVKLRQVHLAITDMAVVVLVLFLVTAVLAVLLVEVLALQHYLALVVAAGVVEAEISIMPLTQLLTLVRVLVVAVFLLGGTTYPQITNRQPLQLEAEGLLLPLPQLPPMAVLATEGTVYLLRGVLRAALPLF